MTHPYLAFILSAALILLIPALSQAQHALSPSTAPPSQRLTLLLSGNIDGLFADVDCRQDDDEHILWWARHAAYHRSLDQLSLASDLPRPIPLSTGNSPFPGLLGRYLATQGPDAARSLAEIIAQVPLKIHGAGNREFTIPRPALVDFAHALTDHGIHLQAANLRCPDSPGAQGVCHALHSADDPRPYQIYERQGLTVAVTTVLAPDLLDRLIQQQRQGIEILDPLEFLPDLVAQMRAAADLVVVQYQSPSRSVMEGSRRLASQLRGVDLVIASHSLDAAPDGQPNPIPLTALESVIRASGTGTPVVSADSGPASLINLELDLLFNPRSHRWTLRSAIPRRVDLSDAPDDPSTAQLLLASIEGFCAQWGDAIGDHATLQAPMPPEDFQHFVLNVMRFTAAQEVALLNRRAFRLGSKFPLTHQLTRADIYAAMPFENRLVVADVSGVVLQRLASSLGGQLVSAGLAIVDGTPLVNGRPIAADRLYSVAINDFLAQGGDRHLQPDELHHRRLFHAPWSDEPPTLGDLVVHFVHSERHRQRGPTTDAISPHGNFPDLHSRFLWTLSGSLNASYNQVAVTNPTRQGQLGYDQSLLTVPSTDQVNFESRFTANADSRAHGWHSDLSIQYARARVHDDQAEQALFETTKDQLRLRSRYRYQGWRALAAEKKRRYLPVPMMEGQLESEFQAPPTRPWRRLDLRGILGASIQLFAPLELRLGANLRHELNRPHALPTWGLNAGFNLARFSPFDLLRRPLRLESEVEYFYNDIARQNIHELRTNNRLFFAVFEQFFFTTTFNAFLYRDDPIGEVGTHTEVTIGVNYSWQLSRQLQ